MDKDKLYNGTQYGRYSRQIPLIGEEGQRKLLQSKVIVVGLGALGSNTAELLVRAGVGKLLLVDDDTIEENNLQRQTLFCEENVGKSKVNVAKIKLNKINSTIEIDIVEKKLEEGNLSLLKEYDLVLDCTDNLKTRFMINKYCRKERITWIYAACVKKTGYVMPILIDGPCIECFLKEVKLPTADIVGIMNTLPSSISAIQTTLGLKLLLGEEVKPILHYFNLWDQELRKILVKKKCECKTCYL